MVAPPTSPSGQSECKLLSGWVAGSAQVLLGCIVLLSLLLKRHRERPQRPLLIWAMDVSKQIVSSGAAHVCGMIIAMLAHAHTAAAGTSECSWYLVIFTVDTSLGVFLTLSLHRALVALAKRRQVALAAPLGAPTGPASVWDDVAACGHYGSPPSVRRWGVQIAEFTLCVALARFTCGFLVLSLNAVLYHIALAVDSLFVGRPVLLLFTVMVCCPLGMNLAQAVIQDQYLKWRKAGALADGLLDAAPHDEGVQLDDAPKRRKAVGSASTSRQSSRQSSGSSIVPTDSSASGLRLLSPESVTSS